MARSLDIGDLSGDDLLEFMEMVCNRLSVPDLVRLQEIAEAKRQEKFEAAKQQVIEEMRAKLADMGVAPDEVVVSISSPRRTRRDSGARLPVKYRGPQGETWSGRGFVPNWLRLLEEQGHNREEFLVPQEGE
jgi:DNA-binding protein H-NS